MKTYVAAWKKLPKSIQKEYYSGDSCETIAIRYGTYSSAARYALRKMGTKMRVPGKMARGEHNPIQKLMEDDVANILRLDNQNVPHADIARMYNVSRERIRQICAHAGHATRSSRIIPMAYVISEQRIARKLKKEREIQEISKAWKSGMTFSEIGVVMKELNLFRDVPIEQLSVTYAASMISRLRHRYGLEMFPYRNRNHWTRLSLPERMKKIRGIAKVWNESGDYHAVRKKFGYKNHTTALAAVRQYIARYPELFRSREAIMKDIRNKK